MTLCPIAWRIVLDGLIPAYTTTPPIVGEDEEHEKLLKIVEDFFNPVRNSRVLAAKRNYRIEYRVRIGDDEWRSIVLRPDLYVLYNTGIGPVNIVVEVTTRHQSTIPIEWLAAYSLGAYLGNLRPTSTLLVTPNEVKALVLDTVLVERFWRIFRKPPSRDPAQWMCSNCDLRSVCPSPLA